MNHNCSNATNISGVKSEVTGLGYSMTPRLSTVDRELQKQAAYQRRKRQRIWERKEQQRQFAMKRRWAFFLAATITVVMLALLAFAIYWYQNSCYGTEEAIAGHSATVMTNAPTFLLQSPEEDGITTGKALLHGERVICTGDTYSRLPAIGRKPVVVMVKVTTEEGASGWIAVRDLQIRASI